ncbi:MAG TPA: SIMPL domain-containing protein [Longimicrobiaceae bacterium]|nr:SIMPL domain-containing protein [Longimicrobiaceae bacterium]
MKASLVTILPLAAVLAAAGAARAQMQQGPMAPATIRVSSSGEARATPDQAFVDFGMETVAPTAKAASDQNAARMARVIAALVAAGIARTDIQTRDYNVYPEYSQPGPAGGDPAIRGYHVNNTVSVKTDRIAQVGALIDAALGAGANRVNGVRFGFRSPETLRAQALRQAIDRGRAEAQNIAAGLGVRLGPVLDASTSSEQRVYPPQPMMMARGAAADAVQTPVEPGEQTVGATISLVFAIAGGQ